MKYLWMLIVLLSACANRSVDQKETKSTSYTVNKGIELLETYQRTVTGGMEREDGKHTSVTYTMVFLKSDEVQIETVYLYGEKRTFESFVYEGKFYVTIKVYPNAEEKLEGEMIQSSAAADVYYLENEQQKLLQIDEFPVKEAIQGR